LALLVLVVIGSLTFAGHENTAVAGTAFVNPTTLSINCLPKGLAMGGNTSCAVTVTDSGPVVARVAPTGSVTLTTEGAAGSFDPPDGCELEAVGAFSSKCTIVYTPTAISGGQHTLLGSYGGDAGHSISTSRLVLTVTPANDEIDAATVLPVAAKFVGTSEGATYGDSDPELCSVAYAPVWYAIRPAQSQRLAVRLTVRGQVDSVVAVFRQERSRLQDLGCALTDTSGIAGVPFDAERGATYLVAVAAPWDARSGGFTIESAVVPAVRFPGARLGRNVTVRLDPLLRPAAALAVRLHEGASYRINAAARDACVHVKLLRRGGTLDADALASSDGCSGYLVYTPAPGEGGLLPLVVSMPEGRATSVDVALRPAEGDDLAPGLPLQSGSVRRGRLSAHEADVIDVYRFQLGTRGDAELELRGAVPADVLVLNDRGKRLACACDGLSHGKLVERLNAGGYFAIVRGQPGESGQYALSLRVRVPTATHLVLKGTPGALAALARVSPTATRGHVVFEIEHFDPLTHWHFARAAARAVVQGGAAYPIVPALGGWRVRARFSGTLAASASTSAWVPFAVTHAPRGKAHAKARPTVCGSSSTATFAVGGVTVTCVGTGFASAQTSPTSATPASPARLIADLKARVSAISMLKEPFRSQLLAALDAASAAAENKKPDDAVAKLDQFIQTLRSPQLRAQVPADGQAALIAAAKRVERTLTTSGG
jgi:hypothetical protein